MKRQFAVTVSVMAWACAVMAQPAQQGPGAGQPVQPRSPEVLTDGKVVFRLLAPTSASVTLGGDFPIGTSVAMARDDKGVWSATVGPLKPDFYSYFFTVDGVRTLDWRNVFVMRDGARYASWLRVPGTDSADYQVNDVPHGTVSKVWYSSPTLGMTRRMSVYTPPGYETGSARYPVLYLLHGGGGDEAAWTELGRAPEILDNLIAQGRSTPMIVVMTNGNGTQSASQNFVPLPGPPSRPGEGMLRFAESLVKDVIPFVDATYRTRPDRGNHALAGLSMCRSVDGRRPGSVRGSQQPRPVRVAGRHERRLPAAAGRGDRHPCTRERRDPPGSGRHAVDRPRDKGVKYALLEVPGYGHEWKFWRLSLRDLLPRLFQPAGR